MAKNRRSFTGREKLARERFPGVYPRIISDNGPQFVAKNLKEFIRIYNTVRLHSAIGYITPKDKLEGREQAIFTERDRKLAEARERRKAARQADLAAVAAAWPELPGVIRGRNVGLVEGVQAIAEMGKP